MEYLILPPIVVLVVILYCSLFFRISLKKDHREVLRKLDTLERKIENLEFKLKYRDWK